MQSLLSSTYRDLAARLGHLAALEIDSLGIGDQVREKDGPQRKGSVVDRRDGNVLVHFSGARVWLPIAALDRAGRAQRSA